MVFPPRRAGCFLIFPSAISFSFSFFIFFSNSLAGSSFWFCFVSLPCTASCKISWRAFSIPFGPSSSLSRLLKRIYSTGYRIEAASVSFGVTGVNDGDNSPTEFILKQNYPNPFNSSTRITYSISEAGLVTLLVYDTLGNEVARLVNENKGAGEYNVYFNASNLSNGIYLYRLQVNSNISIKKMVLLK